MLKINLLDWRAELREKRRKQFLAVISIALLSTVALLGFWWFAMVKAIDHQHERNALLRTEIAAIEKQIKEIEALEKVKQNLLARMKVIEALQQSRAQIVHYFDEIVNTIPEGVYLTGLAQAGSKTTINGSAESNGRVSTYMKNLDASAWFDDPRLIVIKTHDVGNRRLSDFTLEVMQVAPPPADAQVAPPADGTQPQNQGQAQ